MMAIAAAFGPIWIVRLGLAAAIAAAAVACAFAWRELHTSRRAHAQAMLEATRKHGAALTEERTRNAAVVQTLMRLRCRQDDREAASHDCQAASADLQLEGRSGLPAGEVQHREKVISALRETVREREAELIALRTNRAEIHHAAPGAGRA